MTIEYKPAESGVRPEPVEAGVTTVYLRKDITEKVRPVMMGQPETKYYSYQEAQLTHAEYKAYTEALSAEQAVKGVNNAENIKQIMDGQTMGADNQFIVMGAIADMYDDIMARLDAITKTSK